MVELAKYKAGICEGSAEAAIIDILVDNDLLIFSRSEMLDESAIRSRGAKRFEERYLRKGFDNQISVIRILDSHREEFRLSKAYANKIDVINVVTAPEIEMLIIHNEGRMNGLSVLVKSQVTSAKQIFGCEMSNHMIL